jgi:hypothetical protein
MLKRRFSLSLLTMSILLFIAGCINENPALLNPPPQTNFMYVRFINLAKDQKARTLSLGTGSETTLTPYAACSDTIHPPADSATATVKLNGALEYTKKYKIMFIKDSYSTLFAMPSRTGDSIQRSVDTIIALGSISNFTSVNNTSFLSVFNAYPDSSYLFSLTLGCPNGQSIAQSLSYRLAGPPAEIPAGTQAVSLISFKSGLAQYSLYKINLKAGGQYALVIYENVDGTPKLGFLDELGGLNAFTDVESVPDRITNVRTLNFSTQSVTIKKVPDETIAGNVSPGYISDYASVIACSSLSNDTLVTFVGSDTASKASTSLEVLQNFSVAVFDSAGIPAKLTVVIPPVHLLTPTAGRAVVRVINSSAYYTGFTLSIGARDNSTSTSGYSSGEFLATDILYGKLSDDVLLPPGKAPMTLFTSNEPKQLICNGLVDFAPDKNYLVIITDDQTTQGKVNMTLVEDGDVNQSVSYVEGGAFTQVINMVPGTQAVSCCLPPVLTSAKIYAAGSFATVLPLGANSININGSTLNITSNAGNRNLIIAAGNLSNPELLLFQYPPLTTDLSSYKRRFINACKEMDSVDISLNCDTCFVSKSLPYGSMSGDESITIERHNSFIFLNSKNDSLLIQINDVSLPFGGNYTIIFGGSAAGGYMAVVQQEY